MNEPHLSPVRFLLSSCLVGAQTNNPSGLAKEQHVHRQVRARGAPLPDKVIDSIRDILGVIVREGRPRRCGQSSLLAVRVGAQIYRT